MAVGSRLLCGMSVLALIGATSSTPAMADGSWYAALTGDVVYRKDSKNNAGGVTSEIDFDTGYGVDGALGYALGNGLRIEGEVGYRTNDVDTLTVPLAGIANLPIDGDATLLTGFANLFYDLEFHSKIVPYIGGGLGVARYSLEFSSAQLGGTLVDDSDTVFAYHVSAGVGYEITASTMIFLGYRYLATQDAKIRPTSGGTATTEYKSQNVQAGVRVMF